MADPHTEGLNLFKDMMPGLIALRANDELKIHFQIALRNGLTVEEIEEVVYHMTGYAGFPAAAAARNIGSQVLTRP